MLIVVNVLLKCVVVNDLVICVVFVDVVGVVVVVVDLSGEMGILEIDLEFVGEVWELIYIFVGGF